MYHKENCNTLKQKHYSPGAVRVYVEILDKCFRNATLAVKSNCREPSISKCTQQRQKHSFQTQRSFLTKTLFTWSLLDGVTMLFQSGIFGDVQFYQTHKYSLLACEMSKSSDPQILDGSSVSFSHKGLHITVSTTYIEIH